MDTTPFRTARIPSVPTGTSPTGPTETPSMVEQNLDVKPGLSAYEAVEGKPYTAQYFELSPFLDDGDFEKVQQDIREVDEYIKSEVKDKNLKDSLDSYAEIISKIDQEIGVYQNEEPFEHFRRVSSAIKAIKRLKSAHVKPVLDAHNLSVDEYEAVSGKQ